MARDTCMIGIWVGNPVKGDAWRVKGDQSVPLRNDGNRTASCHTTRAVVLTEGCTPVILSLHNKLTMKPPIPE